MFGSIITILSIGALLVAPYIIHKRRKKEGVTGFKSLLTSACFFLIAIINILAYWFDVLGATSWFSTMMLLFVGAYFTKYLPPPEDVNTR
ncbi:hypothetical protein [Tuberibacillus sp. Marseille-P3662]|uniref:hypothetical protein n=1 Tax=Tuberibacillus sp. Marseille-P3662 TaxID=1965358 RepID=UPI000A1C9F98|nr:hypothetical protein [Tuberibacillus sp. Marseille-P3662]